MPRNYSRDLRPAKVEARTVQLWRRFGDKRCPHQKIVPGCKHCMDAVRIEIQWNKPQQRSAS